MLVDVAVLPSALAPDADRREAISLLRDLSAAGVLLIDDASIGIQAIAERLRTWPQEERSKAELLLRRLSARGHIVPYPARAVRTVCDPGCDAIRGVASALQPAFRICADGCCDEDAGGAAVSISEYSGSELDERLRGRSIRYRERVATEEDLERDVFGPVARYAPVITVYDRYLGRSMQSRDGDGWNRVKGSYMKTIQSIASTIRTVGRNRKRSLRIITGLQTQLAYERPLAGLADFERRLRIDYSPIGIELLIYAERPGLALDHDRFLLTSQISIQVSSGFDLLFDDDEMRARGLDPSREARPAHRAVFSVVADAGDLIIEAGDLDLLHPTGNS